MDYDDNEFQGQNLHLTGEGSSKFSPVLCPYALPKFDFDDSLQGPLKFDSLVENEVFLGIPSQEDNQWIEDFSRSSSGIEFSSSAAESCSISRRNVWSEATSSESVEMLLKSVGQQEMVPEETIIEESDTSDELGSLNNLMEPNLKQDDRREDVTDSQPAVPPDLEKFSELNETAGCEKPIFKCPSQTQEAELSTYGSLGELDPNAVSEKGGLFVTQENLGIDRKCDDATETTVDMSITTSLNYLMEKNAGMPTNNVDSFSENVVACIGDLSNQEIPPQVSDTTSESTKDILTEANKRVEKEGVPSKAVNMDDQILRGTAVGSSTYPLYVASMVESVEEHAVETSITNFEDLYNLVRKGSDDLQAAEDCNEGAYSTNPDKGSMCEINVLSEVSGPEAAMLPEVENEPFGQGEGGSTSHFGDLGSFTAASSSSGELLKGNSEVENLEGGDDASGVHQKNSNCLDSDLSPVLAGSMQMCEENTFSELGDACNSDKGVTSHGKKKANLPTDTSYVEGPFVGSLDTDKTVGSLLVGECIKENVVIADGSEIDNTSGNRRALEDNHIASHAVLDCNPSLSGNVTSAGEVIDHNKVQESPFLIVELTHMDKKEEMVVEVPTEVRSSAPKECSQVESELGSVYEGAVFKAEKGSSQDCAAPMLNETVDQSVSMVETCNMGDHSEQAVVAKEVNLECSENLDVYPVPRETIVKADHGSEAVSPENHTEMMAKDHEMEPLKVAADPSADHQASIGLTCSSDCDASRMLEGGGSAAESDKPSCDSPTVFSCIEISQIEKGKQDGLKGAIAGNASLSEVAEKAQAISLNPRENDANREERSFTFEVSPAVHLSEGETGKVWQSFPTLQACKISMIVEGSPSTSGAEPVDPKMVQEISRASPQAFDGGIGRGGDKITSERKTRRASGRASAKENSKKGFPMGELDRGNKSRSVPMSPSGTGQLVQFEELKPYGNVERSVAKPSGVMSIATSNLPDLNTSAPLSALFQQPFTDLQQVQLRAQILVYGSLIQGAAPDEACMISAFGPSDGEMSSWEPAWRTSVERLHGQKSHANNSETPMQSHSGARVPDQSAKQSSLQNKALSSSIGRASGKGTPSPVVSPMMPLSSPLWNISTPCDGLQSSGMQQGPLFDYHQILSPLHPFQTPPIRNLAGHNNSWLSQAPFPGPWVTSPQTSAFDFNSRFSALPFKETVKLTPVNESSVPISSGIMHVPPIPVSHIGNPSVLAGTPAPLDTKKVTVSPGQHTADPKTRKRKKVSVSENLGQISLFAQTRSESLSTPLVGSYFPKKVRACEAIGQISLLAQTHTEPHCVPFVTGHFSTAVAVTAPSSIASKSRSDKFLKAASPSSSTDHQKGRDQNVEKKVIIPEEAFAKVEEAKLKAEDAAAHAAAAVSQCEEVWSQLGKQTNSGLLSDVEAKLASAAVAIAAAASVAKAAAAAAQIASNAAAQAKLMADEALAPSGTGNAAQSNVISDLDVVNNFGKATPISILKAADGSKSSSSVIAAAREASRRRVEAASTASRKAENLDAIIKAAELAAAAVSQSGTIVAMGDPLPLRVLVEAGPEGYWKVPHASFERGVKSNNKNRDQADNVNNVEESPIVSARQSEEGPLNQEAQTKNHGMPPLPEKVSRDLKKDPVGVVEGMLGLSVTSSQKDSRGKRGHRAADLTKTIGVVPESDRGLGSTSVTVEDEFENMAPTLKDNSIEEGHLVEVFKDGGHVKAAWFPANVLSLKDGKAFVCYTKLESDEGSGQLKEWVPLEGETVKPPRIRIPHPMTSVRVEGTKKRSRAAFTDYTWSVGDKVDVLMEDCWHEGVVTEKNEKDETKLTVHFPAEGETSVVRVWHLRPTVIWKDGKWIEWSTLREKDFSVQGDTRQEKRMKLGSPVIEGEAKDKTLENIGLLESEKHQESSLLPLAVNEKIFNVGKDNREENKPVAPRTMRSGLQKEGSRVIFGVPKPGKKRKFMEVSKHYVGDRSSKNNIASDSVKLANYLMPQGSGSRGWRNNYKIDAKEKQAAESRPRILKSGKPPIVSGRTSLRKDKFLATQVSATNDSTKTDAIRDEENGSGQQNLRELESFSNTDATEGPIIFSSLALPADAPSKKISASNAKFIRQNKGKLVPVSGKLGKIEVKDKSIPDTAEPRRSNRRIQPTSRLLEGLQSSLITSKIPAASHDRSHKIQSKGPPKGSSSHV